MASGLEREAKGYSESTYKTDKCASPSANKSGRGPGAGLELALLGLGKGEIGTFMMGVLAELRKHLLSMAAGGSGGGGGDGGFDVEACVY